VTVLSAERDQASTPLLKFIVEQFREQSISKTGRVLRGLLYGLNTVDGISFAGVSLLFLMISLLAAYPRLDEP
jgi:hypothetical protein